MPVRDYSSHHSQLFGYQAHDRLPEGHICFLIDDVIEELKLAPAARGNTVLGAPTYEPRMRRSVRRRVLRADCRGFQMGWALCLRSC